MCVSFSTQPAGKIFRTAHWERSSRPFLATNSMWPVHGHAAISTLCQRRFSRITRPRRPGHVLPPKHPQPPRLSKRPGLKQRKAHSWNHFRPRTLPLPPISPTRPTHGQACSRWVLMRPVTMSAKGEPSDLRATNHCGVGQPVKGSQCEFRE